MAKKAILFTVGACALLAYIVLDSGSPGISFGGDTAQPPVELLDTKAETPTTATKDVGPDGETCAKQVVSVDPGYTTAIVGTVPAVIYDVVNDKFDNRECLDLTEAAISICTKEGGCVDGVYQDGRIKPQT